MFFRLLFSTLVLAAACPAGSTLAQSFGLQTGLQKASIRTKEAKSTFGTEVGYTVGLFVNIGLGSNFGIFTEASYSQKIITQQEADGTHVGQSDPDVELQLGSIEIPVALAWKPTIKGRIKPRIYAGPVLSVIVDETVSLTDRPAGDVLDEAFILTREAFADRDFGWVVGTGVSIELLDLRITKLQLLADIRYVGGLNSVKEGFAGNPLRRRIGVGAFSAIVGVGF